MASHINCSHKIKGKEVKKEKMQFLVSDFAS